jgi:hypothetical protein
LWVACSGDTVKVDRASDDVIAGARRAMGGAAADAVTTLHAEAAVRGPEREFVTHVWSAADGRARMEQSGFIAVVHPSGSWQIDTQTGEQTPLLAEVRSILYGHELHMATLSPLSRYGKARFAGQQEFAGAQSLTIELAGVFGEPVLIHYSVTDTMPLGFRMTHPEPDVIVTLDNWIVKEGVRLFSAAEFIQGSESFQYSYTNIELNTVVDSVFVSRHRRITR